MNDVMSNRLSVAETNDLIEELRQSFSGEILLSGSEAFDDFRRVFNAKIDATPLVILRPATVADVQEAVRLGRVTGLPFSVRGGGRHVAGYGTNEGGIVLEFSLMKSVSMDPERQLLTFQPGVSAGDLLKETTPHGLAPVTGAGGHIGAMGLMLGGGIGYLSPRYGFAADNIVELEIVMSDGSILLANERENADLFWGMRGAGPNFGVVVSMTVRLHPVPASLIAGGLTFRLGDEQRVVDEVLRLNRLDDPDLFLFVNYSLGHRPTDGIGATEAEPIIVVTFAHLGDATVAEELLEGLRSISPLADTTTASTSYLDLHLSRDGVYSAKRQFWGAEHVRTFDGDLSEIIRSLLPGMGEHDVICAYPYRGAMSESRETDGAFACRTTGWDVTSMAFWDDPNEDEARAEWARGLESDIRERGLVLQGVYPNMASEIGTPRLREYYGDDSYERLKRLKQIHDPGNMFRLNSNIVPSYG